MQESELWSRFKQFYYESKDLGVSLDISRIKFPADFMDKMRPLLDKALNEMQELEKGAIANPDEQRMVGHYWLRAAALAPTSSIRAEIEASLQQIKDFSQKIIKAEIKSESNESFKYVLVIGIGGSALGPQFLNQALCSSQDPTKLFFFDNTDPDGMQRILNSIPDLSRCLCIVISKSGGTKETRNGMLVAEAAFKALGLSFPKSACAVTGINSELDLYASKNGWLCRFPMFDWVGGRTSELSAVGLLPAALQGVDIDSLLNGAAEMDVETRQTSFEKNPAAMLAAMWWQAVGAKGEKDMVVLPYNDRLELFSKYLQQLVMESLGKEKNLAGELVNQGIAVYGNKGSTDQHAYVQQLRDGVNNFFTVFIRVLSNRAPTSQKVGSFDPISFEVESGVTSGDYLSGFFQGTRQALYENERESITISIKSVSAYSVGQLIALFERTVGFYASLVGINAYHQPGVEAGKKAATSVLSTQAEILNFLKEQGSEQTLEQIAKAIGVNKIETIFLTLQHLSANGRVNARSSESAFECSYSIPK